MRKLTTALLAAAGIMVVGSALADLTVKDGGGVTRTIKNFVCETTKLCNATVLIKSDGTEIGTSSAEVFVGGRGTAGSAAGGVLTVQGSASGTAVPVSLASVPSHAVTNAGTFATQSAVTAASGSYSSGAFASGSYASGAFAAGSMVDLLTMRGTIAGGTAASNAMAVGGIYNSTPLTLTNTQGAALQFDVNGYLKVNTAAGAAAGGTSSNFGSAFPTPGTAIGFTDGTNMVAGRVGAVANVAAATNFLDALGICNYNATPLTVTDTRYQSIQCDVNGFLKVNVTNTNANGQAALASSSPVAIAKNSGTGSTVAGAAVGTAGTPSAEYVSVQGPVTGIPVSPGTLAGGATFVSGTTAAMTGTTSTQIIALVSSQRIYVTRIKCNNTSATATLVQIRDGSAGTVLDTLAAGATYGGEQGTGPTPLFWTTAGTALYAQNVTTSASVICTASGYSG